MRPRYALVIIITTLCLFAQSMQTRQLWMQPTYSIDSQHICPGCSSMYEWLTAHALIHVNNWLQENPWQLRFALFHTPHAIEAQTLDQRIYYGSYPPGAILPLYVMISVLSLFEPELRHDRTMQLRLIMAWNHAYHMLLALVLCFIVYQTLRRSGCDVLNATLMACTPAIVQYSNAHSLFWFNLIYSFDQAVLLPCALYVWLEQARQEGGNVSWKGKTAQALLAFYGTLTDWLFVFFALVVYLLRLVEGRIALPRGRQASWHFLRGSFLFFLPSLVAVALWLYQVQLFSSPSMLGAKLSSRMGLDIPTFTLWMEALLSGMFLWPELGYGASGVALLYIAFYLAVRVWWRERSGAKTAAYQVANCYLLLWVPCLAHVLFFVFHSWDHLLSSLKFSLPLSVLFALLPHMLIRVPPRVLFQLKQRPVYVTTAVVLMAAVSFGYVRSREATRFFSLPDPGFAHTGNFIRTNTVWQDVVFSREAVAPIAPPQMQSLAGRVVHVVTNLDHVYQLVQNITADFTIKIFYYPQRGRDEIDRLAQFLARQDLPTSFVEDEQAGGLLAFDGKDFVRWYREAARQ